VLILKLKNLLRLSLLFLAVAVSTLSASPAPAAEGTAKSPIQSASEVDYPPFSFVNAEQEADGFSVQLLRAAVAAMGQEVVFATGLWNEVKQSLVDGRIDVLPLVGRTPEREAVFDFTFPYLELHGTIVVRQSEQQIQGLTDLKGKNVAVMKGDNAEEFLRRSALGANIIPLKTFPEALQALARGEYDAVVIQKLLATELIGELQLANLKTVGPPLEDFVQKFCFAVTEGNRELLAHLNEGLAIVMANGTFDRLWRQWLQPIKTSAFEHQRIVVGGDDNYPPYEYLDANGQPAGYNIDLTRAIAEELGLQVTFELASWGEIRQKLDAGQIDLVNGMFYSPEREESYVFSPQHIAISHVSITREGREPPRNLTGLSGRSVAVMAGDITHDLLLENSDQARIKKLVATDSQQEALRLVQNDEVDVALAARLPALYWIEQNDWQNLRVGSSSFIAPEYCYAGIHGAEEMVTLFAEGLAAVKESGKYRGIYNKHLGSYEAFDPTTTYVLLAVAAGLLTVLVATLIWNSTLKKEVARQTLELSSEVEERKKSERAIRQREETISMLLNSTAEGIYGVDRDEVCIFCNNSAQRILGYDEEQLIGTNLHHKIIVEPLDQESKPMELCRVKQVIQSGEPIHIENNLIRRADGSPFHAEIWVHPMQHGSGTVGAVVTFLDISEKISMQEQHLRSSQLSALGEVAAGVAHEINNPINGVINYAQILLNTLPVKEREEKILNNIIKEGSRISSIVSNLLHFSRKSDSEKTNIHVKELIDEPLQLYHTQLENDGIALDLSIPEELPGVYGNVMQLEQVVLNLLSNARHALSKKFPEPHADKILKISAELNTSAGEAMVQLVFFDHGCGIAANQLKKIFNPFYTTKAAGVGTGLGLSISHDTVTKHGGTIRVESELDRYTRVTVELPASKT